MKSLSKYDPYSDDYEMGDAVKRDVQVSNASDRISQYISDRPALYLVLLAGCLALPQAFRWFTENVSPIGIIALTVGLAGFALSAAIYNLIKIRPWKGRQSV